MNPRTSYHAKFSMAYVTATALLEGRVGLEEFSQDRFSDAGVIEHNIASLLPRVSVAISDKLTVMYPRAWPSRIRLTLKDDRVLEGGGDYPRGNPENPVSTAILEDKFRSLIMARYGDDVAGRAVRAVQQLMEMSDMATAFSNLM